MSHAGSRHVVHSVSEWLGPTKSWIRSQIDALPAGVLQDIVTRARTSPAPARARVHPWHHFPWLDAFYRERQPYRYRRRYRRYLGRAIRRLGPDVVHSHFGNQGYDTMIGLGESSPPHVVTFYGYDASRLPVQHPAWRDQYFDLFESVAAVLCEGPAMATKIRALGCPADKARVHPLGVCLENLPFRPRVRALDEPLRILIAGRFHEKKGIPEALSAVSKVHAEIPCQVTLVGDRDATLQGDQEFRRIGDAIREGKLDDSVEFRGLVPHEELVGEAYRHDLFVSPSVTARDGEDEGGCPVSIIEMAATGLPVISTRHCDIPFVLQGAGERLLAAEHDVDALARHITWCADHPIEAAEIAGATRRRIEAGFDARKQGVRLAEIYESVLS